MGRRYESISFLSDLGTDDESAGVVRAVIRDLAPHITVIDLTHGIAPFDVRAGALALVRAVAYVPTGVVLACVDPEAGSARQAIAVEVANGEGIFVGPNNGLLAPAIAVAGGAGRAVVLEHPDYRLEGPGATFAARDVLGPAAAHLGNGVDLLELGPPVDPAVLMPSVIPLPRVVDDGLECEVLWVDRFGNAQLNVGPDEFAQVFGDEYTRVGEARLRVLIGDQVRSATVSASYAGIGTGAVALVVDSVGMYALAMERYSAAGDLGIAVTDRVRIEPLGVEASRLSERGGAPISAPVTLRATRPAP